jgi:hypothetical protein
MKQILFLIFIIGITTQSFGQAEFNSKFKAIPPADVVVKPKKETAPEVNLPKLDFPKIVAPNVFKETNIFGTKPKENDSFKIGVTQNKLSMTPKKIFEHSMGDVYRDRMTKDLHQTLHENDGPLDRRDRDLGTFTTKSKSLVVKYRDYIEIDGDMISVYLDSRVIQSGLFLGAKLNEFVIPLSVGINNIEFVVASQGTSGGNTAEIHVIDDANAKVTDEYWDNLALGTKIRLIIVRE